MSGADGTFQDPPTITINFTEPQSFYGCTLTFDAGSGEYPEEISVNGKLYYPNAAEYVVSEELTNITNLTISFLKSGQPYRRARLSQILFGQIAVFDNSQLTKMSFRSSIDLLSTALSQKRLSFTIDNSNNAYNPLNPKGLLQFA